MSGVDCTDNFSMVLNKNLRNPRDYAPLRLLKLATVQPLC